MRAINVIEAVACFALFGYGMAVWRFKHRTGTNLAVSLMALGLGFIALLAPTHQPWLTVSAAVVIGCLAVVAVLYRKTPKPRA
jgi:CHASE2 domain-containing sensor protein